MLIPNQKLQPGIIGAGAIVGSKSAFMTVINSNINDTPMKSRDTKFEFLNNTEILATSCRIENKKDTILKILKFFTMFKQPPTEICTEIYDIFGIETEPISSNNFYKQRLRRYDKTPIYIKNYRISEPQKLEIDK